MGRELALLILAARWFWRVARSAEQTAFREPWRQGHASNPARRTMRMHHVRQENLPSLFTIL